MKVFFYVLGIITLGYIGELKCDAVPLSTAAITNTGNSRDEMPSGDSSSILSDLCADVAASISGDFSQNKAAIAQMSKQEFDLLVRKQIAEQKNFLRYMQVTGVSLTFLMTAIAVIMSSALLKAFRD